MVIEWQSAGLLLLDNGTPLVGRPKLMNSSPLVPLHERKILSRSIVLRGKFIIITGVFLTLYFQCFQQHCNVNRVIINFVNMLRMLAYMHLNYLLKCTLLLKVFKIYYCVTLDFLLIKYSINAESYFLIRAFYQLIYAFSFFQVSSKVMMVLRFWLHCGEF